MASFNEYPWGRCYDCTGESKEVCPVPKATDSELAQVRLSCEWKRKNHHDKKRTGKNEETVVIRAKEHS